MTILTCNDHMGAAVCFTGRSCPLCDAIEYREGAENKIEDLENQVYRLKEDIADLKEAD